MYLLLVGTVGSVNTKLHKPSSHTNNTVYEGDSYPTLPRRLEHDGFSGAPPTAPDVGHVGNPDVKSLNF